MNTKNKFLIISDLDGTLLNSKGKLSNNTIKGIKKIVNEGHIFCISTGRPIRGALDIYNQLNLNTLMLNYNGSYISNPSDETFNPIDLSFNKEIAKSILNSEKVRENIDNALIEGKNKAYLLHTDIESKKMKNEMKAIFHIDLDKNVISLNNDANNLMHDVNSILLNAGAGNDKFDKLVYWIKQVCGTLIVRNWSLPTIGNVIEINSSFASKGMGLEFLSSYYGIPKDRIIAFGDGENDMDMLARAKYGFAMKNGSMAAKVVARHITKFSNDDDGVVWELDYFLNKEKN